MSWKRKEKQEKQLQEWADQLNMSSDEVDSMSCESFDEFDDSDADKNYTPSPTSSEEENRPSTSQNARKGNKQKNYIIRIFIIRSF